VFVFRRARAPRRRRPDGPVPPPAGPLLIVVHPGSACGSATFNLGRPTADAARTTLARAVERWRGHLLVIDGALSEELRRYPGLWNTLEAAITRCRTAGFLAGRRRGDDPTQVQVTTTFLRQHRFRPTTTRIRITGAWYDPANREGCVNSVRDALVRAGHRVTIDRSAVRIAG
jgi:hypothetical protein